MLSTTTASSCHGIDRLPGLCSEHGLDDDDGRDTPASATLR